MAFQVYEVLGAHEFRERPSAIAELKAQHNVLRGMMERCESLADELDGGRCGPLQLTREVARLRLAFEAHNRFEEEMLRPILFAGIENSVIDRQIEEHVQAHRAMRLGLASNETDMLRGVIDSMRAHLDAEETFISAATTLRATSVPD
jgi:hypothetical protein